MDEKKEESIPVAKESAKTEAEIIVPVNPAEKQPLILVKKLAKSYKKKLVLKDVDFDICEGDIFGIIGMSGSGKTTLFNLLSGSLSPDAGDVLVRSDMLFKKKSNNIPDYVSVFKNSFKLRKNVGFAAQLPSFYEHLTVEENMMFYGSLHGISTNRVMDNVDKLLDLVNLTTDFDTVAEELSGGMQRRLDIACSLIHDPKILLLDEPTSDLDPIMRKQIWDLIRDINSKGTTVIIASHILEEVEMLCTKIAVLHNKKILGYGTLDELHRLFKRKKKIKIEFESRNYEKIKKKLSKAKFVEKVMEKDNRLIIFVPVDDSLVKSVIKIVESSNEKLVSFEVVEDTLTEIFEKLAKED